MRFLELINQNSKRDINIFKANNIENVTKFTLLNNSKDNLYFSLDTHELYHMVKPEEYIEFFVQFNENAYNSLKFLNDNLSYDLKVFSLQ